MPVPDPTELLALAVRLAGSDSAASPDDAACRRAISTAYYAVFHKLLGAAAKRFMGPGQERTAGYALIYRGFDHRGIRTVCEALRVPTLKERYRRSLQRQAVSQSLQDFADGFLELQNARYLADYDPGARSCGPTCLPCWRQQGPPSKPSTGPTRRNRPTYWR